MNKKKTLALLLCLLLLLGSCAAAAGAQDNIVDIVLSDNGITVDGIPVSVDETAAVHTAAEIVYYKDGTDETYGEGSESEKHSAEEAAAHTVVTITKPGTYRLSGTLSKGQIAIDLGEEAAEDPAAVVTVILDGADVTCTVAPALIFYNVYECGVVDTETAGPEVDTSAAGANVVIAAGSVNTFRGSHVARIYKEGTTKKLHKYDGAFYAKTSMNLYGDNGDDSGILHIIADNEGLNSELHLTIEGGTILIESQDDGINTNEDFVSVTTIKGGTLKINAGLGAEGDGIDSNGYLTIEGGTVWTMANERTPDGGIDADGAITIKGGTLLAFGTRNDAADSASSHPYMELSFASTLPAGSVLRLDDPEGKTVWSAVTEKACQSVTLTAPELKLGTVYSLYVDDLLQCYSGNGFGGFGGGRFPQPPEGFDPSQLPEDFDPTRLPEDFDPARRPGRPEGVDPGERPQPGEGALELPAEPEGGFDPANLGRPQGEPPRDGEGRPQGERPGGMGGFGGQQPDGSGSTEFLLNDTVRSFSGVCDSDRSGKTRVTFTVEGPARLGRVQGIEQITAITPSVELDPSLVQITVTDDPSEDYAASCLLSDGLEAVNALLPEDRGSYLLTVAVISGAEGFTGASQTAFEVGALPFLDVDPRDESYEAIDALYAAGILKGIEDARFGGDQPVTRAQAVTALARLANVEQTVSDRFADVAADAWYAGYVGWAAEHGIVLGDENGLFRPDLPVTAADLSLMIGRWQQSRGEEMTYTTELAGPVDRSQLAQMLAPLLAE